MEYEYKITSTDKNALTDARIESELFQRKYKKCFFDFLLKLNMPNTADYKATKFYARKYLYIISVWHLGVGYHKDVDTGSEITLYYHTKGSKFLDFFGVSKKWEKEAEELTKKF